MLLPSILLLVLANFVNADYYGSYVNTVESESIVADIYLINSTHVQFILYQHKTQLGSNPFEVIDKSGQHLAAIEIYKYNQSPGGDWLFKLKSMEKEKKGRYVLKFAGDANEWKTFKMIDKNKNSLITEPITAQVPKSFCCFVRERDNIGLFGEYGIISDPIEVIDSKTIHIPKFSYEASQTPDGYFYAGTGKDINQNSGKKAMIIGVDQENRICAMRQDIQDRDIVIRLMDEQTIYNIEWLSVFCYQYSHDFGHLDIGLVEDEELVPPYMPPVLTSEPPKLAPQNC